MIELNNNIPEEIQIKMIIKGKTKEMFQKLKEFYNLGYNSEVIRLIIKKIYDLEFNKEVN